MVSGGQGSLPVKRRLFANSTNASNPVLADDLIIVPGLLCLGVVEVGDDFGVGAGEAGRGGDGVMPANAAACACVGGVIIGGGDGCAGLGRHGRKGEEGGRWKGGERWKSTSSAAVARVCDLSSSPRPFRLPPGAQPALTDPPAACPIATRHVRPASLPPDPDEAQLQTSDRQRHRSWSSPASPAPAPATIQPSSTCPVPTRCCSDQRRKAGRQPEDRIRPVPLCRCRRGRRAVCRPATSLPLPR